MVRAGFERDVNGCAARVARGRQRPDLGVVATRFLVPAFADDPAVPNEDATDHRVRRGRVTAARGEFERARHPGAVGLREFSHRLGA